MAWNMELEVEEELSCTLRVKEIYQILKNGTITYKRRKKRTSKEDKVHTRKKNQKDKFIKLKSSLADKIPSLFSLFL